MIYIKQKYLYINNKFKTIVNKIYVILIAKVLCIKDESPWWNKKEASYFWNWK